MRLLTLARPQRGISLVALMVGLAVGLIIISAALVFFVNTVKANREVLAHSRLDIELLAVFDHMSRDIRRAQYHASAATARTGSTCNDPFCDGDEDFSLANGSAESGYQTLLLSYDQNLTTDAQAGAQTTTNAPVSG